RCPEVDLRAPLADPEPLVVEAAAWAAGERCDRSSVDAVAMVATNHPDPLCREAAVAALGAIGDERGLPAILAAQRDRPAALRQLSAAPRPQRSELMNIDFSESKESRHRPAPTTTVSSGVSTRRTGSAVSSLSRRAMPWSSPPPPTRWMPWRIRSWASSGGA